MITLSIEAALIGNAGVAPIVQAQFVLSSVCTCCIIIMS